MQPRDCHKCYIEYLCVARVCTTVHLTLLYRMQLVECVDIYVTHTLLVCCTQSNLLERLSDSNRQRNYTRSFDQVAPHGCTKSGSAGARITRREGYKRW